MNVSASLCGGSGCESGWTHYLDQSSYSQTRYQNFSGNFVVEDDEEQDLSMVSDASSGPRHYCQDYEVCLDENVNFPEPAKKKKNNKKKKKIKEYYGGGNQQHSYLDDTASSHVISYSKTNCKKEASMELLEGSSGTHLNGKSAFNKKFGFSKCGKTGSKDSGESFL